MNETDARMEPYPKECGLGNPVPIQPVPDPATELIRELRDALKVVCDSNHLAAERGESIKNWPDSYADKLSRDAIARATAHLGAEAGKEGKGES